MAGDAVPQQTIARSVAVEGIALHAGGGARARLSPAAEDAGIVFVRSDSGEETRADCLAVGDTRLATTLGEGGGAVSTIEHLLSALSALSLDNLRVEIDGGELPIFDGSAAPWLLLLGACGVRRQEAARRFARVKKTVEVSAAGGRRAAWRPAVNGACRYRVAIDYPHAVVRRSRASCEFTLGRDDYERQISRARTFCHVGDVEAMRRGGRARGGALQNAVVYDDRAVINPEGLRYADEFVRHKTLDAIGDCYVNGHLVLGDYFADSPGHDLNNQLMRALSADADAWEWTELPLR